MKVKIMKFFWGVVLVLLVGLSIACLSGYVPFDRFAGSTSSLIFTGLSAAFLLNYFVSGINRWGWLFPALFSAALALNAVGVFENYGSPIVAFPFLLSLAIPLYVGYILNRKHWEWLVPAWFLTIITLIPPLAKQMNLDVLGALVLYCLSLPFLVGYLVDQQCKWALFISAVLGFIGIFSLVETFIHGDILGPIVMLLIALPFFITFFASKQRWWALIPSGVFISIGLVALLNRLLPLYEYILVGGHHLGVYTGLLFLGFAVTFAILWQLDTNKPKEWARFLAIGFFAASVLAFLMGKSFEAFLPEISLLIIGFVMLSAIFLKQRVTNQPYS
jgi:hypothetical protein